MYKMVIEQKQPIDGAWYKRLLTDTAGIGETFVLLEPSQRQIAVEREKFFGSGCSVNPHLRPKGLNESLFKRVFSKLRTLQADIQAKESNEYIREAYIRHIDDYCLTLEMLVAASQNDHDTFMARNFSLYGAPHEDVVASICTWLTNDTLRTAAINEALLGDLRREVLRLLPSAQGDESFILPPADTFQKVRAMHFKAGGYFDQLFAPAGLPQEPFIDQLHGDIITKQAIRNVRSDYGIKTAADGLWAVLSRSRQVVRPLGYRVDRDYFAGIIAHEVGSHLLEDANGARQSLRLLGLGLNGFEKGDEGRAYLREQIIYPDPSVFVRQPSWEYILILHLSVSLACGALGKRWNFAELYELLYALHRFWRQRRFPMASNNDDQAREEAWLLGVRIMKGTDGAGGCYMKDTVYLEGNIACWMLARNEPALLLFGDIGKFNITDPSHIAWLRGLNILPGISDIFAD